jgi:RNA recognition motif-containing protein
VHVGNINEDLTEIELKTYFNHFGRVIDVKICPSSKQQSERFSKYKSKHGFVVFEDNSSVKNLLSLLSFSKIKYVKKGVECKLKISQKISKKEYQKSAPRSLMSNGYGGGKSPKIFSNIKFF